MHNISHLFFVIRIHIIAFVFLQVNRHKYISLLFYIISLPFFAIFVIDHSMHTLLLHFFNAMNIKTIIG